MKCIGFFRSDHSWSISTGGRFIQVVNLAGSTVYTTRAQKFREANQFQEDPANSMITIHTLKKYGRWDDKNANMTTYLVIVH